MALYKVISGSHYCDAGLLVPGDTFADPSETLHEVFSTLAKVPEEAPKPPKRTDIPQIFEAKLITCGRWGVYAIATGQLILKKYLTPTAAVELAEKANLGQLDESYKDRVTLGKYREAYASASNR